MDEQGFDFQRRPHRREPRRFEPPPWEKDAFDELQRRKSEEEEPRDAERKPEQEERKPVAEQAHEEKQAEEERPEEQPIGGENESLDERTVIEMLAELAAEEPPPMPTGYYKVAIGTGMGLTALGAVLLIWGMAALVGSRQTGSIGQLGGVGLGFFGAFFMGMGVWLIYRTLKQRGVL